MTNDITAGGGRPVSDASFQCILESKYAVINILRPLSECEKLLLAARLQRRVMTAEVSGTIIMEAGVRMCPVIVSTNTGPDMSTMFDDVIQYSEKAPPLAFSEFCITLHSRHRRTSPTCLLWAESPGGLGSFGDFHE